MELGTFLIGAQKNRNHTLRENVSLVSLIISTVLNKKKIVPSSWESSEQLTNRFLERHLHKKAVQLTIAWIRRPPAAAPHRTLCRCITTFVNESCLVYCIGGTLLSSSRPRSSFSFISAQIGHYMIARNISHGSLFLSKTKTNFKHACYY